MPEFRFPILFAAIALGASPPAAGPAVAPARSPGNSTETAVAHAEEAFERMKDVLVGEWKGRLVEIDSPVEATFYLTGNESALVEDIRRPDKPASRMHTVYHLAGDRLQLTHYCSYRNQPRLVAGRIRDEGTTIEFEFVDVTNLSRSGNRYTHRMIVSFPDRNHASIAYVGVDEGHEGVLTAELVRIR